MVDSGRIATSAKNRISSDDMMGGLDTCDDSVSTLFIALVTGEGGWESFLLVIFSFLSGDGTGGIAVELSSGALFWPESPR